MWKETAGEDFRCVVGLDGGGRGVRRVCTGNLTEAGALGSCGITNTSA